MFVCMCVCVRTSLYMCLCVCLCLCVYVIHTKEYVYICIYNMIYASMICLGYIIYDYGCVYIYIYIYMCVCACVSVCICVIVCVHARMNGCSACMHERMDK